MITSDKLTLLLMRHGKSDWGQPGLDDHDRTLTKRGKRDAKAMGAALAREGLVPELVLCSSAKRARSTARRVAEQCDCADVLDVRPSLYHDGSYGCLEALSQTPDAAHCVLLVGHNPTLEELVAHLTHRYVAMATATIACLVFKAQNWQVVAHGAVQGNLHFVWTARELRGPVSQQTR